MSTQHTPGPWSTYLNTADDMVVRKMFPDGQEAFPIARVQSPNAICDARQIAAAPDMYEALKAIVADSRWISGEPNLLKAQAAIAKAEGKS